MFRERNSHFNSIILLQSYNDIIIQAYFRRKDDIIELTIFNKRIKDRTLKPGKYYIFTTKTFRLFKMTDLMNVLHTVLSVHLKLYSNLPDQNLLQVVLSGLINLNIISIQNSIPTSKLSLTLTYLRLQDLLIINLKL